MDANDERKSVSRRRFLRDTMTGAAATAALAGTAPAAAAQGQPAGSAGPGIRRPSEFDAAAAATGKAYAFPMTGAEVFARACKEEGVAALFCCPGNYTIIHALASAGIPAFGGRRRRTVCPARNGS